MYQSASQSIEQSGKTKNVGVYGKADKICLILASAIIRISQMLNGEIYVLDHSDLLCFSFALFQHT